MIINLWVICHFYVMLNQFLGEVYKLWFNDFPIGSMKTILDSFIVYLASLNINVWYFCTINWWWSLNLSYVLLFDFAFLALEPHLSASGVKTDFPENSSVKVLQDNIPRSSKNINFRKTEENLIGISRAQQPNAGTSGVSGTKVGSGAEFASVMKPMMKSASTPSTVRQKKQDAVSTTSQLIYALIWVKVKL